uniref:Putative secreted peptide n=1 Tax=Anopheles braziliensis TaxID=58242 RepID=A0A2M3ZS52_9DIPT
MATGFCSWRPLMAYSFCMAAGLLALQASPYTVSVGRAITCPDSSRLAAWRIALPSVIAMSARLLSGRPPSAPFSIFFAHDPPFVSILVPIVVKLLLLTIPCR